MPRLASLLTAARSFWLRKTRNQLTTSERLHECFDHTRSGVYYVTIHRAEKGSTRITLPVIIALAKALGVSTDSLLGLSDERITQQTKEEVPELLAAAVA
jgi:hypothetical protein